MSFVTHHFVASLRQGLTGAITGPAQGARAAFHMRVTLEARKAGQSEVETEVVDRQVQLFGPGDVLGFDAGCVVRTDPKPGVSDFEDNFFPAIELSEPDFLWRFSADAADADGRLRPWLALVVLETGRDGAEIEPGPAPQRGMPRSIRVLSPEASLPDLEHAARWAHVRAVGGGALDVAAAVTGSPEAVSCCLVCPRRLRPKTAYAALVVPAFELGRCAGLGIPAADGTDANRPAWVKGQIPPGPLSLPYYYRWDFRTGTRGDFESLVRLLQPRRELPGLGLRPMSCAAVGYGLPPVVVPGKLPGRGYVLDFEGAICPPGASFTTWGADAPRVESLFRRELAQKVLNLPRTDIRSRPHVIETHDLPPEIVAVAALPQPNVTSVLIKWATAVPRTSVVEYGREGEELRPSPRSTAALATAHAVLLAGLEPGAAYRFRVSGADGAGVPVETAVGKIQVPALPTVTPPIYGGWHAAQQRVSPDATGWVDVLNLDPRHRGAAGFGAEVIRKHQESLMASAWEQLGEVERANEILRRGQLARDSSDLLWKRLSALDADSLLQATAPVHARTRPIDATGAVQPQTVERSLARQTYLPRAALSPAFRRLSRPRGPIRKRQPAWTRPIVSELSRGTLQVIGPTPAPAGMSDLCAITHRVEAAANAERARRAADPARPPIEFCDRQITSADLGDEIDRGALDRLVPKADAVATKNAICKALDGWLQLRPQEPPPLDVPAQLVPELRAGVIRALDPRRTITRRVRSRLRLADDVPRQRDPLDPILWAPEFPQPMYEPLRDLSQDLILPGVKAVPQNSVMLLETNRRFLESYMVGLNHEMAAELLWRGYPTDQRGSCFRQFWDVRDRVPTAEEAALEDAARAERYRDVARLHAWRKDSQLGKHPPPGAAAASVVLLIRGEVLRRYPNTIVYAVPAVPKHWNDPNRPDPKTPALEEYLVEAEGNVQKDMLAALLADNPKVYPIFRGELAPDLTFFGFPFDRPTAEERYFVLEEHMTEPRFGLDLPGRGGPVAIDDWQDLAWDHFARGRDAPESGWYLDGRAPSSPAGGKLDLDWWAAKGQPTSAQIAWATMQSPVRIAMPGRMLLPKSETGKAPRAPGRGIQ
jgi:hypothetical protein